MDMRPSFLLKTKELGRSFIEIFRPGLVGRKFSVFSIQTFRKQGKHV